MQKPVRLAAAVLVLLAGCATNRTGDPLSSAQPSRAERRTPARVPAPVVNGPSTSAASLSGPALIEQLLPQRLADRRGWAEDMHAAMSALRVEPTPENVCAAIAITEQESSFRVDPSIPGLPAMARRELDKRRELAGIPKVIADSALKLVSSDGRTYEQRLDSASTERQLSDLFEDFSGRVPLGKALFSEHNPVRSGGPMQVSIGFAQTQAASTRYPFAVQGSIRDEVFTRRGGLYFGLAALRRSALPLRRLHRGALRQPQRRVSEGGERADRHRARARRRRPALRAGQAGARGQPHRGRGADPGGPFRDDDRRRARRPRARAGRRVRAQPPLSFGLHHGRRRGRPAHPARGRADDRGRELQDAAPPDELRLRHARRRTPQGLPRATVVSPKPAVRCRIIAGR